MESDIKKRAVLIILKPFMNERLSPNPFKKKLINLRVHFQ